MISPAASSSTISQAGDGTSASAPFRSRVFTILWIATVVSNIGTWMYNAGASWLMTSLDANPLVVSLVQVATTLPIFLFAVPAGALADILDRRRFLIAVEVGTIGVSAVIAVLVTLQLVTPAILLLFTFLLGASAALSAPAWQAIVPQLVPKRDLGPAVAANSVGINISRAIGPAIAGAAIAAFGIAMPFWINAISNIGIVAALLWWCPPTPKGARLPPEHFFGAIVTGLRHARHNSHLRATLIRAVVFFIFASSYWALLPLVARERIVSGPELYGILLGVIGASAVVGGFALPVLKRRFGADLLVALGTCGTAAALFLFGLARTPTLAILASAIAGLSWICVLASLNVSAQVALPDWVRGRGLAVFAAVFFGAMSAGSASWGQVAGLIGLPGAHYLAALGAIVAVPLTWRWKLQTGSGLDLTPSMHWPAPILAHEVEPDRGPVLVTVEYRIDPRQQSAFLEALEKLAHARRRDGAYNWQVYEDPRSEGRYLETFSVESWVEHLRQHRRVTNADRVLQTELQHFNVEGGAPTVTHYVAARPRN